MPKKNSYRILFSFTTATNYSYPSATIVVTGGVAKLKAPIQTTNPKIIPNTYLLTTGLDLFTSTWTTGADALNAVRFTIEISGIEYWYNGSAWAASSGYTQTNTAAEINANLATLLSSRSMVRPVAYLHSNDGSSTPSLDDITIDFDYNVVAPTGLATCLVYGNVIDSEGNPLVGIIVSASPQTSLTAASANYLISSEEQTTTTDSNGYWNMLLVYSASYASLNKYVFVFENAETSFRKIYIKTVPSSGTAEFYSLGD